MTIHIHLEIFKNKIHMFEEFGNVIDTGLNLRGIVDGADFVEGPSAN